MSNSEAVPPESVSETPSQSSVARNVRLKTDAAWEYAIQIDDGGKRSIQCVFCQKIFSGGGISRFKYHLMGIKGDVSICKKVLSEVRDKLITLHADKAKAKSRFYVSIDSDEVEMPQISPSKKRAINSAYQKLFKHGVPDHSQVSIKAALQSKERWHDADLAWAMWFYDAGISFNALKSPYFQIAIDKSIAMGHGYTHPSYHALRVGLLRDAKKSVELIIEEQRKNWKDTGCTIMTDGWTDSRQRPLINFLISCPQGITFVKSVDASNFRSDATTLCNLFSEIVEWAGIDNVVQIVTDNGANYKAAGRLISEKYTTIFWSPCAAHCINLILKDICEMSLMKEVATMASKITVFVYNHKSTLNWLRQRPGWNEIVRPGVTRFATTFIALQSLYEHRVDLEALVTSQDYAKHLKTAKGIVVKQVVLDYKFWKHVAICVKLMAPLMRLLRICDGDDKPAMGYVYEGMRRARKAMKDIFLNKKRLYKPYTDIIKARWTGMFCHPIHMLAYQLNPAFQYDQDNYCKKQIVIQAMLDFITLQKTLGKIDSKKLFHEIEHFKNRRLPSFAHEMALDMSKSTSPDSWWKTFGGSTPTLQWFAIRFLSQTASSSGCEHNWSTFDWIHSKRRNRLEHQRLNDLVYIHYNLRLRNRCKHGLYSYDPVDYESIDKTEFWIVEQEPEEDIGVHELETMLEEAPICVQEQTQDVGEDILATGEIAMFPEADWENENWLTQSLPREES